MHQDLLNQIWNERRDYLHSFLTNWTNSLFLLSGRTEHLTGATAGGKDSHYTRQTKPFNQLLPLNNSCSNCLNKICFLLRRYSQSSPLPPKKKWCGLIVSALPRGRGGGDYLSVRSALHLTPPQPILTPSIRDTLSSFSHNGYCVSVCSPCLCLCCNQWNKDSLTDVAAFWSCIKQIHFFLKTGCRRLGVVATR